MIRNLLGCVLVSLMLVAGSAAAELKIAVLDTQRALLESEEAKRLLATAQTELQREQDELNALAQQIMGLQEQLQKDAEVMSASEQRRRQKEIEDKQIDYQFLGNKLQKEVQDRRQELMQQLAPKIDAVLRDLIESEGYDLILQRGSLLFASNEFDITRKVTERMNERRD